MKVDARNLKHLIEKNKIENIYLFQGPEIGEKSEIITLLEQKIFPEGEPVRFTFFCGESFDLAEFENTLVTNLLFSDKKMIFLKNIEEINSNTIKFLENYIIPQKIPVETFKKNGLSGKKEISASYKENAGHFILEEKLKSTQKKSLVSLFHESAFKNYDTNTYLIMLNETNEKIPQGLLDILAEEQNIMFWEMFENQKFDWVRGEFKKKNISIQEEAVYYILDSIENNKSQLAIEISKIIELFESQKEKKFVDLVLIEEYLYHSKAETPFSLYSALLNGNLSKALDILETLFLSDEITLLNGIVWAHRRFLKASDLYENQKMLTAEIFSNLKIFSMKDKKDFEAGLKKYSFYHLSLMHYYLSELDYYLKILPSNLKLIKLQEFLIMFTNGDIQKSFLQGPLQYLSR
jgi:DNA polymerase III subunit delta